jgi:hypothetical protein
LRARSHDRGQGKQGEGSANHDAPPKFVGGSSRDRRSGSPKASEPRRVSETLVARRSRRRGRGACRTR